MKQAEDYQPRTLRAVEYDNLFKLWSDPEDRTLAEIVKSEKKIAVLGEPGSGKSTELNQLAEDLKGAHDSLFEVFLVKLNNFNGEAITEFLPEKWKETGKEQILIILDGLDEVRPELFQVAVRNINAFSSRYEDARLVVSCRTNFYEPKSQSQGGTLTDFAVFSLNAFNENDIKTIIKKKGLEYKTFHSAIVDNRFQDISIRPFFLQILAATFMESGGLEGGRKVVFDQAIRIRLAASRPDDKNSSERLDRIVKLLSVIALSMEILERNYISDEEIKQLIGSRSNYDLLLDQSIFSLSNKQWMFEHNNIQEYLAASLFSQLPFDKMITLFTVPVTNKIRPSWMNTLSFLVSILENGIRDRLVDWIVLHDPEVLVRFETGRIPDGIRFKIFKRIFEEITQKKTWIRNSNFSEEDLASFSSGIETRNYLLNYLNSEEDSNVHGQYNAIILLFYFTVSPKDSKKFSDQVFDFIDRKYTKEELVYPAIILIGMLNLQDKTKTDHLIQKLSSETSRYYRAALYRLITLLGRNDEFASEFLKGIDLIDGMDNRVGPSLMDESMELTSGIESLEEMGSFQGVLEKLTEVERPRRYFGDGHELLEKILLKAKIKYNDQRDQKFLEAVKKIYLANGYYSEEVNADALLEFIKEAGHSENLFKEIIGNRSIDGFRKGKLISRLLTPENADLIHQLNKQHDISDEEIVAIYHGINVSRHSTDNIDTLQIINDIYEKSTGLNISVRTAAEWDDINRKRVKKNFDCLFSPSDFLLQAEELFAKIGRDKVTYSDSLRFYTNFSAFDPTDFPVSVVSAIRDLADRTGEVELKDIQAWVDENADFMDFCISEIYRILKRKDVTTLDAEQRIFVGNWCESRTAGIRFEKEEGIANFYTNEEQVLYKTIYFIKNHAIGLPEKTMLNLSRFCNDRLSDTERLLPLIEERTSEVKVEGAVTENLCKLTLQTPAWAANATWAIDNQISETMESILLRLNDDGMSEEFRKDVAERFLKQDGNPEDLFTVAKNLKENDRLIWPLIDLLNEEDCAEEVLDFLLLIMNDSNWTMVNRLEAARRLSAVSSKDGFDFYADAILMKNEGISPSVYKWLSEIGNLTQAKFIAKLVELYRHTIKTGDNGDSYYRIDTAVISALHNISQMSPENLEKVDAAIRDLIEEFDPQLDFLKESLERQKEQFYTSRAKIFNITSVIDQLRECDIVVS